MMSYTNTDVDDINYISIEKFVKQKLTHRNSSDDDAGYLASVWKKFMLAGSDTNVMNSLMERIENRPTDTNSKRETEGRELYSQ